MSKLTRFSKLTRSSQLKRFGVLALVLAALPGCGGMNRAVGVLPNTLDDLGRRAQAERAAAGQQPGDEALAVAR